MKTITSPFTLITDTREQTPFTFSRITSDAREGRVPVVVTCERRGLPSGDYSIGGCETEIAIERKSLSDLYSTLGGGRARFTRELERLSAMRYAAVVAEAEWATIMNSPPIHSQMNPKTVYRSVIAWQVRYPSIHWWMCPGREFAEVTTYRLLERWWIERERNKNSIELEKTQ